MLLASRITLLAMLLNLLISFTPCNASVSVILSTSMVYWLGGLPISDCRMAQVRVAALMSLAMITFPTGLLRYDCSKLGQKFLGTELSMPPEMISGTLIASIP